MGQEERKAREGTREEDLAKEGKEEESMAIKQTTATRHIQNGRNEGKKQGIEKKIMERDTACYAIEK